MPGQLYHTNEITVLLGDNWFAQVTAKQARDIVNRRQKGEHWIYVVPLSHGLFFILVTCIVVEEKLSDAKRQLKDIEAKLAFTTSFQQQVTCYEMMLILDNVALPGDCQDQRRIGR